MKLKQKKFERRQVLIVENNPEQMQLYKSWLMGTNYYANFSHDIESAKHFLDNEFCDLLIIPSSDIASSLIKWFRDRHGWDMFILCSYSSLESSGKKEMRTGPQDSDTLLLWEGADQIFNTKITQSIFLGMLEACTRRINLQYNNLKTNKFKYQINKDNREIILNDQPIKLTSKEYELAVVMFENMGKLLSRIVLLNKVWKHAAEIDTRTVDAHISRLKTKLNFEENGIKLASIYGYGYKLDLEDN